MKHRRLLRHTARLHKDRAESDRVALTYLRDDQCAYYRHLLLSWGARESGTAHVMPWRWDNPESRALRKTLEQRP